MTVVDQAHQVHEPVVGVVDKAQQAHEPVVGVADKPIKFTNKS